LIVLVVGKSAMGKFHDALLDAKLREIGGVLVGEHIAANIFQIIDFSVQKNGGTSTCFTRSPKLHQQFLKKFFTETANNYQRYNYLGEWHSHPSFSARPSLTDLTQMAAIATDPKQSGPFVILIIVRLDRQNKLEIYAAAHMRDGSVQNITVQHGDIDSETLKNESY
jgi:integrative and conjugative element protein (TIGR02256 family)